MISRGNVASLRPALTSNLFNTDGARHFVSFPYTPRSSLIWWKHSFNSTSVVISSTSRFSWRFLRVFFCHAWNGFGASGFSRALADLSLQIAVPLALCFQSDVVLRTLKRNLKLLEVLPYPRSCEIWSWLRVFFLIFRYWTFSPKLLIGLSPSQLENALIGKTQKLALMPFSHPCEHLFEKSVSLSTPCRWYLFSVFQQLEKVVKNLRMIFTYHLRKLFSLYEVSYLDAYF